MFINFTRGKSIADLATLLVSLPAWAKGVMILAGESNGYDETAFVELMQRLELPVFGGLFPRVLFDGEVRREGAVVVALPDAPEVLLCDLQADVEKQIAEKFTEEMPLQSMVVIGDVSVTDLDPYLTSVFNVLGLELDYVGGVAGSFIQRSKPCLITSTGLHSHGLLLAGLPYKMGVGVRHGLRTISGPYRISGVHGLAITSLDNRPAREVFDDCYAQLLELPAGYSSNLEQHCAFGLVRYGRERIVREVTALEGESALVMSALHVGDLVDIVYADEDSIRCSARDALRDAVDRAPLDHNMVLVFSCVGRLAFSPTRYGEELVELAQIDRPVVGVLALGEIAANGQQYLELYNRTCVVSAFHVPVPREA